MLQRLFTLLSFGCHHRRLSKPFSAAKVQNTGTATQWERVESSGGSSHYVVCLDCGRKFAYDWSRMKMVR